MVTLTKSLAGNNGPMVTSWGGCTNPSEKYARQIGFIFLNFRGENKKTCELPPPG